jgi:hypothetical protein
VDGGYKCKAGWIKDGWIGVGKQAGKRFCRNVDLEELAKKLGRRLGQIKA